MTTIVVCLDGTNQIKTQAHPTNVALIFDALGGDASEAGNGSVETTVGGADALVGKYLPGVGTQGSLILKGLGDLFGDGVAEPILRGYTFLSRNFAAGDTIFVTGFSRGAAAARALADLVVKQGMLDSSRYDVDDKDTAYMRGLAAWRTYEQTHLKLDDPAKYAALEDRVQRTIPSLGPDDFTTPPTIRAVGVFDTVSSIGIPQIGHAGAVTFNTNIIDTSLHPRVENGLHALAGDEHRDLFSPTYWSPREGVVQHVFPGEHSDVGGGNPRRGLSDAVLMWMLDGFAALGLTCDPSRISPPVAPNPLDLAGHEDDGFAFLITPRHPRAFPLTAVANAVLQARWGQLIGVASDDEIRPYFAIGRYEDGSTLL
jgi:glutathione S-transferase